MTEEQGQAIIAELAEIHECVEGVEISENLPLGVQLGHRKSLDKIQETLGQIHETMTVICRNMVIARNALAGRPDAQIDLKASAQTVDQLNWLKREHDIMEPLARVANEIGLLPTFKNRLDLLPDIDHKLRLIPNVSEVLSDLYETVCAIRDTQDKPVPQAVIDQSAFARMHAGYDAEVARMNVMVPSPYKVSWYIHAEEVRYTLWRQGNHVAGFKYDERDGIVQFARDHNAKK